MAKLSGSEIEKLRDLFIKAFEAIKIETVFNHIQRADVLNLQRAMNRYVMEIDLLSDQRENEKYREETSYDESRRSLYEYYLHLKNNSDEIPYSVKVLNSLTHFSTKGKVELWKQFRPGEAIDLETDEPESPTVELKQSISTYLNELIAERNIGFEEEDKITYQISYGKWMRAMTGEYQDYRICEEDRVEDRGFGSDICVEIHQESDLEPIHVLLEQHFEQCQERNHSYSFSFVVADFGKGKSVLMTTLAADYAQRQIDSNYDAELAFPVYINLRNAATCLSSGAGLIQTYLKRHHQFGLVDISQFENIVFLLDSFDELSATITAPEIIEEILPALEKRVNPKASFRFVIATRPISSLIMVLDSEELHPFYVDEEYYGDTPMFIHAFGFTEEQVDNFFLSLDPSYSGIYQKLLKSDTLKVSELRRPLLSYILYKILQNGKSIDEFSRISIYLTFINYITIEAKYIGDPEINLLRKSKKQSRHSFHQQAIFRSILHGMAVLWIMNRSKIRKLNGSEVIELNLENLEILLLRDDAQKISNEKQQLLIDYLSNSYFGESDHQFQFKHQSFAEILLAEYYLKVLLVFVFEKRQVYDLDNYLAIGRPTRVAIEFYKELLELLKKSSSQGSEEEVLNARKLLSPLVTSISIRDNNHLYSRKLDEVWRTKRTIRHFENFWQYPRDEVLEEWPITPEIITEICNLCDDRINQESIQTYDIISEKQFKLNTLVRLGPSLSGALGQETMWLLLIAGNYLYNEPSIQQFFASRMRPELAFKLIKMSRFGEDDLLSLWGNNLFKGLNTGGLEHGMNLSHVDLSGLDFSYAHFIDFNGFMLDFRNCNFENVTFDDFEVEFCNFSGARFETIKIIRPEESENMEGFSGVSIHATNSISGSLQFPNLLRNYIISDSPIKLAPSFMSEDDKEPVFKYLMGLWKWVFDNRNIPKSTFMNGFMLLDSDEEQQIAFERFLSNFFDEHSQ